MSNRGSDDVSVISVERLEEIGRLPAGEYPQRMDVALPGAFGSR